MKPNPRQNVTNDAVTIVEDKSEFVVYTNQDPNGRVFPTFHSMQMDVYDLGRDKQIAWIRQVIRRTIVEETGLAYDPAVNT